MKNGVVISDSGPVFSLAVIDKLDVLSDLFDEIYIPKAVWDELALDKTTPHYQRIAEFFKDRVR